MRGSLGTDALFDTKWMALSEKDGGYQDKADNGAVITRYGAHFKHERCCGLWGSPNSTVTP